MNFDDAFRFVLTWEGGFSNHASDPGGATRHGISSAFLQSIGDTRRAEDIEIDDAKDLYREHFWDKLRCDVLPPSLALMAFDSAVNQGPGFAARTLQSCVNATADGVTGTRTLAACRDVDEAGTLLDFAARRGQRYATTKNVETFGFGWFRRLLDCYATTRKEL